MESLKTPDFSRATVMMVICLVAAMLFISIPATATNHHQTSTRAIVPDRGGTVVRTAITNIFDFTTSATRAVRIETPGSPQDLTQQAYEKEFADDFHYNILEHLARHSARRDIHLGSPINRGPN